jgi:predicted DsbA family dithiol-disulfide isomerase
VRSARCSSSPAYAQGQGLSLGPWSAALDGSAHADEVEADKRAADAAGITGTPSFLIGPTRGQRAYYISGAQSYATFRRLIERALREAK